MKMTIQSIRITDQKNIKQKFPKSPGLSTSKL